MIEEYEVQRFLTECTRCKACDRNMKASDIDPELCNVCMEVVMDINEKFYEEVDKKKLILDFEEEV